MIHRNSGISRLVMAIVLVLAATTARSDSGGELRRAAFKGDAVKVASLIAQGVSVNAAGKGGGTPLIKAAKAGHMAVVQLLLFHGADPRQSNKKGRNAIDLAEKFEHYALADVMRDGVGEQAVTLESRTPLEALAFGKHMSAVFAGRKWQVEQQESGKLVARYERKGRAYKVQAMSSGQTIVLKYLRGYGTRKTGYLENLKQDLAARL